ncbi:MAG TPA: hypothetical protein VMT89_14255, partial [Candidatus Acidoferrales bacterium]|nr:hypothetical protein [Candidatus Acidoferrales bacterium]
KSPLPPFDIILLDPSLYHVTTLGNSTGIQVLDVPAMFAGNQSYDFFVNYNYSGDFALRTNNVGTNASVELFDSMLTPYVSYQAVRSDVLSGTFPGTPVDSTTYTSGLLVRYLGLQVRGEYQKFEWEVSPYEQWKAEMQYVQTLDEDTGLYGSGAYINKHYPHGTSESNTDAFTEQTETVSASIQRQFLLRTLFVSLGGSYAHVNGQIDSDASSINSSLLWKVGKVDLTVGANAYMSDSSGDVNARTKRDHEFLWVNLRRRLF